MKFLKLLLLAIICITLILCLLSCGNEPFIGQNGNWWVGNKDTGVSAEGQSAYEMYCEKYNYTGTKEEWLKALVNGELSTIIHTVTFDPGNGEATFTQTVKHGEKATFPTTPAHMGYTFAGWIYEGAEGAIEWSFAGYSITEDITLTAKWDYATYELPIININTNSAEITSKETYVDMTFSLENCDDELDEVTGGIRLRGNTSRSYPKKPYRIKFDKKQSLFGLDKAKSWVLLADYLDPSGLRNHTAFSLGSEMPGLSFTPTPHKINLYLNGKYVGIYTLCEQVQENEGRMNIELDEITPDMTELKDFNFFISMDYSVIGDYTAVLGETYFYVAEYDKYFELKYPEKDQFVSDEQFESFFTQLQVYTKEMMDAFYSKDVEKIKSEVNINSLADYLIIDQIMGERDHESRSFNMYYTNTSKSDEENGRLNFGPIWDYDLSLWNHWTGAPNESYIISDEILYTNQFFKTMAEVPEFYEIVKNRYNTYGKAALEDYIDALDKSVSSMQTSLELNRQLWYSTLDPELAKKNVAFLKAFLERRKEILDVLWSIQQ